MVMSSSRAISQASDRPGLLLYSGVNGMQVLTNHGSVERPDVRTCRLPDIKRKMIVKNATASDLALNQVISLLQHVRPAAVLSPPSHTLDGEGFHPEAECGFDMICICT
jgi:hypothetical protein